MHLHSKQSVAPQGTRSLRGFAGACWTVAIASLYLGTSTTGHAAPLQKVSIVIGASILNIADPWLVMPQAVGYWRAEGYDVELVSLAGSTQAMQQMVAGGAQFAQLNSTNLVNANADNNLPVRGIMDIGVVDWGMGVPEGSSIKRISDLKGKKIGIVSFASGGVPLLKSMLTANGLDPDKDVQIVATGGGAPALDALKNDRVQAVMYWQAALTGFENAGLKLRVFRDPSWRDMPDYTLATLQSTYDKDPKMVEAIARGAAKAILFANTSPLCVRLIQWKHYPNTKPSGMDEAATIKWDDSLLAAQMDTINAAYAMNGGKYIGAMDPAGYERLDDFMLKQGLTARKIPAASMLITTPGFIEAVNRFDHHAVEEDAHACKAARD
jgi:NitT/TauT family transport system substrate-binding protein